jgi:hypothetical protein
VSLHLNKRDYLNITFFYFQSASQKDKNKIIFSGVLGQAVRQKTSNTLAVRHKFLWAQ